MTHSLACGAAATACFRPSASTVQTTAFLGALSGQKDMSGMVSYAPELFSVSLHITIVNKDTHRTWAWSA